MVEVLAQQERERAAILNRSRNQKRDIQEGVRGGALQKNQNTSGEEAPEQAPPAALGNLLALKRAAANKQEPQSLAKKADNQLGAAALGWLGAFVIPGLGWFIGSYIGKRFGFTGIVISIVLFLLVLLTLFIVILAGVAQGYCSTYVGSAVDYFTTGICQHIK